MPEEKPKVVFMLQDSAQGQGGVVYDCNGYPPIEEDNAEGFEAIGTWYKLGKGTIFVALTTTVEARQDILTNLLMSLRKSRIEEYGSPLAVARYPQRVDTEGFEEHAPRKRRATPAPPEPSLSAGFGSLRDRLKRR